MAFWKRWFASIGILVVRWARSTMVLVPLFGTHYALLLIFSVPTNDVVHIVWLLLDQTFASFQGALVALLYCLMTQEVRMDLKRRWENAVTSIAGCRCGKKWCCCYNKSNGRLLSGCRGGSLLHSTQANSSGGVVACQAKDVDIPGRLHKRLDGVCIPDMNATPVPILPPGDRPLGPMAPDRCVGHAQSWV